jgi:hypothetical protein
MQNLTVSCDGNYVMNSRRVDVLTSVSRVDVQVSVLTIDTFTLGKRVITGHISPRFFRL